MSSAIGESCGQRAELDDAMRRLRKLEEENDTLRILLARLQEEKSRAETEVLLMKARLERSVRPKAGNTPRK